jgi:hypothetical protein
MLISSPNTRHTVEKFDTHIRVTLPSKRNILHVLFISLWLLMWGFMVSGLLSMMVTFMKVIEIGRNSTPAVQPGDLLIFVIIFFALFLVALLALGGFGIYRFGWLIAGQEVIEATQQTLTVTKQIFRWKRSKQYISENVNNLRTNTQLLSVFLPGKRVKRFLGGAGMIAFDYGGRTSTFGLEINEAEAEQIILALKEGLLQQKAG